MSRDKQRDEPSMITQIKEAIQGSGQTLVELSQATDVSPSQLSRFLRGQRDLTLTTAARVCDALGLHLIGPPASPSAAGPTPSTRPSRSSTRERPKPTRKAKKK